MKPRLLVLLLVLALLPLQSAWAQVRGIGAYFTLVNTYIYSKGPHDGRRTLVRPRQAFNVLDVVADSDDALWFLIVYPGETAKASGTGWTPNAPHELLAAREEPVLVFSHIPGGNGSQDYTVMRVPGSGIELLNEAQSGAPFAQVDWQRVRYQVDLPLQAWARGSAGIYRPGKSAAFVNRVYGELVTRNVEKERQTRLLSGVVRIGDSVREVRWAVGDPLRAQEEQVGEARRTVWQYPEMTVTIENDVVKQIN